MVADGWTARTRSLFQYPLVLPSARSKQDVCICSDSTCNVRWLNSVRWLVSEVEICNYRQTCGSELRLSAVIVLFSSVVYTPQCWVKMKQQPFIPHCSTVLHVWWFDLLRLYAFMMGMLDYWNLISQFWRMYGQLAFGNCVFEAHFYNIMLTMWAIINQLVMWIP